MEWIACSFDSIEVGIFGLSAQHCRHAMECTRPARTLERQADEDASEWTSALELSGKRKLIRCA
jgi:hypothetical protein